MSEAILESLDRDIVDSDVHIRNHYKIPFIFDHVAKFHYATAKKNVLVLGSRKDTYYGLHVRNVLREECGMLAPLIDLQMLPRVALHGFDEILVCYSKPLVEQMLGSLIRDSMPPFVYLDDLISRYHWLFAVCGWVGEAYSLRDTVRGILGQPVEEVRAVQFDGWSALAAELRSRPRRHKLLSIIGSGCGLLPLTLRGCAERIRVYETDPIYLNNIYVAGSMHTVSVGSMASALEEIEAAPADGHVVIFCDAMNRASEPGVLEPLMQAARSFYFSSFLSVETKPHQAAMFRLVGDRNIPFGREDRRDLRCLGEMPWIWLPRESTIERAVGAKSCRTIFSSNELFSRPEEYASSYRVLHVTR